MIDYIFRWDTEALAIADVETWPQMPGARGEGNVWAWDLSTCHPVTVARKTGLDLDGNEITVPVLGWWLWIGLPTFRTFLANRLAIRVIRDRESRRVKVLNSLVTKAQLADMRVSPVVLGSNYNQAAPTYEAGV